MKSFLILAAISAVNVTVVEAQTRADTVAVLRAVLKKVEDPLGKAAQFPDQRMALESTSFRIDEGAGRRTLAEVAGRPRSIDEEIVASGTRVKLAAPLESQPRECVPRGQKAVTVCVMKDFNVLLSFSAPTINGNVATVTVRRRDNGYSPTQPFDTAYSRYELARGPDNRWAVTKVQVLQAS